MGGVLECMRLLVCVWGLCVYRVCGVHVCLSMCMCGVYVCLSVLVCVYLCVCLSVSISARD